MSVPSTNSNSNQATPSVLVVDNDLFFSARILSVLDLAGFNAKLVSTREAAERELLDRKPDMVILNLASPALGQVDLIRHVKAVSPTTKIVTFLSHMKIPEVRAEVMTAGADKLCANSAISMRLPDIVRDAFAGKGGREED